MLKEWKKEPLLFYMNSSREWIEWTNSSTRLLLFCTEESKKSYLIMYVCLWIELNQQNAVKREEHWFIWLQSYWLLFTISRIRIFPFARLPNHSLMLLLWVIVIDCNMLFIGSISRLIGLNFDLNIQRRSPFHVLWRQIHCSRTALPYVWFQFKFLFIHHSRERIIVGRKIKKDFGQLILYNHDLFLTSSAPFSWSLLNDGARRHAPFTWHMIKVIFEYASLGNRIACHDDDDRIKWIPWNKSFDSNRFLIFIFEEIFWSFSKRMIEAWCCIMTMECCTPCFYLHLISVTLWSVHVFVPFRMFRVVWMCFLSFGRRMPLDVNQHFYC